MHNQVVTHAAVGIIQQANGQVLLAERPVGKPWSGYWEFPGGKIEDGESAAHALARELKEELGIAVVTAYPWLTRSYDYPAKLNVRGELESPAKTVKLHFFIVTQWQGAPQSLEQQQLSWQNPRQLSVAPMLPANAPIMQALCLPQIYTITNLAELGEAEFFACLTLALQAGLSMLLIREKHLSREYLYRFVERVMQMTAAHACEVWIHSDVEMARQLNAAGVHFSAADLHQLHTKPAHMRCGASCHHAQDLAKAVSLGLDYVMLSPVQATKSHLDAQVFDWQNFAQLIVDYALPVYALGGMRQSDLTTARTHGAHGVAMLSDCWK